MIEFDKKSMIVKLNNKTHPFSPTLKNKYIEILSELKIIEKKELSIQLHKKSLVFIQTEDITDHNQEWLSFILHTAFKVDVEDTIIRFFQLIDFLQKSKIKVFFVSRFDLNSIFVFFVTICSKVYFCKKKPLLSYSLKQSLLPVKNSLFFDLKIEKDISPVDILRKLNKVEYLPLESSWIEDIQKKIYTQKKVTPLQKKVYDFNDLCSVSQKISSYFFSDLFYFESSFFILENSTPKISNYYRSFSSVCVQAFANKIFCDSFLPLLKDNIRLYICHPKPTVLQEQLKTLKEDLYKHLHANEMEYIWNYLIFWSCSDPKNLEMPKIYYHKNNLVHIVVKNRHKNFYTLFDSLAKKQWVLSSPFSLNSKEDKDCFFLSQKIFLGFFTIPNDLSFDLILHVQSLFFEELVHICKIYELSLSQCLTSLKENNWSVVVSYKYWQLFFQKKQENIHGAKTEDLDFFWNLYSSKKLSISLDFISLRLMVFVCILALYLLRKKHFSSYANVDIFVHHLLGTPYDLGLPSLFIEKISWSRLQNYCEQYWPQFKYLFLNLEKHHDSIL